MTGPPKAIVIGYGNTLRGDDAFGPQVAERLQELVEPSRVHVLTKHCLTPEVAHSIADVEVAVFVDATVVGVVGQLQCDRLECHNDRSPTTAHASEPADLLSLAAKLYKKAPRSYLVTVRGESFDLQPDRLSHSVRSVVDPAAKMILSVLEHELNENPRRADPVNV